MRENMEDIREKLKRIEIWWNGKNRGRPLYRKILPAANVQKPSGRKVKWENEKEIPDFDSIADAESFDYIYMGESYPTAPHIWGNRGTPMTMASYLGGGVLFRENTVWVEPVVENWENFEIKFDAENHWVKMSRMLMEKQVEKSSGNFLVSMPDLGDALTCMSMLRGTEKLLFDVIERPALILEKVKEFTDAWKEAHSFFYNIYRTKLPGDCSWLVWAPGKTYACQCDFSTMISPKLFDKFVVFELEQIKDYLEYIIWHLDGYVEVRHLDILLGLPCIKAFQVVPGAGNPPCASETWLPVIKKITDAGKMAYVYANNEREVRTLVKKLPSEQLFIDGGIPGNTVQEVDDFIKSITG